MSKKPHPVDVHVGQKIRNIRRQKRFTQTQLADQIGVQFQQLQKYETAGNRVSASRLSDIATALKVSISVFFPSEKESAATDLLSKEEIALIHSYRTSSRAVQKTVLELLRAVADS